MHTFRRGALELTYHLAGSAEGAPLLLLHNAASTFRATWRREVLDTVAPWFRLIGPDLRGHGRSGNPDDRLDLGTMADDTAALLDHLGTPAVHLLAFSGGASVALYLMLRHPSRIRSQVLIGSHYTVRGLRTRGNAFWDPERIRQEQPAWWSALLALHGSEQRVRALLRGWRDEDHHRPDLTEQDFRRSTAPTLLIVGADDAITPIEQTRQMAAWMPDARLVLVERTGHDVARERPDEFLKAALAFWREIGAIPNDS